MTMDDSRVYLMNINLHGVYKYENVESSIQRQGKLITLNDGDRVVKYHILHCDDLLLCITRDYSSLVVWNPYCGQTRWIKPRDSYNKRDNYALGYEMKNISNRSHKILRYLNVYNNHRIHEFAFEIYNFDSDSWEVVDVTQDGYIRWYQRGVTIKGILIGLLQQEIEEIVQFFGFLLFFDFTKERFRPRLPMPFQSDVKDTMIFSRVGEEQLGVLLQRPKRTEIWIGNKIEPNAVSWSRFILAVGMSRLVSAPATTFFVDKREKVAVIFDNTAYIIGDIEYFKEVDLGDFVLKTFPFVCSYVPSSV